MSRSRAVPTADALAKAEVLAEALPWLERFRGATVVVKYGGNAMTVAASCSAAFAEDVVFLRLAGLRPVVVHGGGPQINAMLDRLGVDQRVPRRPAGDHAGDHGRRADGAHRPGAARAGRADQRARPAARSASPGRTRTCSPPSGATVTVDGEALDLGLVGDVDRRPPGLRRPACSTTASSRSVSTIGVGRRTARCSTSTPTPPPPRWRSRWAPTSSSCSPTSRACTPTGPTATS